MKRKSRAVNRTKRKTVLFTILVLFVCCAAFVIADQWHLTVVHYQVTTDKLGQSVRIVELTDLHNREFGKGSSDLVAKIKEQSPDLIAMVGDMNADNDNDEQAVIPLISKLTKIAPVYYVLGNHELKLKDPDGFAGKVKDAGAVYLKNEMAEFPVGDKKITIGGLCYYPFYDAFAPDYDNPQRYFLEDFSNQENFKLLLCHFPEYFIWRFSEYDIDLMLAGHTHGGVVRVPFLGGIVAPNQEGLFPEYCDGFHTKNGSSIIISKGLGSNKWWIPRINNPPEITVIDIGPIS